MTAELTNFIAANTVSGSTRFDYFAEVFLTSTGRLVSPENRTSVRLCLAELGYLSGDNVTRALGGALPINPVFGNRTARP